MADYTRNNKAVRHKVSNEYESPHPSHAVCYLLTLSTFRTQSVSPDFENFLTSAHF